MLTQKDLRELKGLAVGRVEGLGYVPHQLHVLGLVVTHRNMRCSNKYTKLPFISYQNWEFVSHHPHFHPPNSNLEMQ